MSLSENIIQDIQEKIEEKKFNINFFRDQIISTDSKKEPYDESILQIDQKLLNELTEVNNTLYAVQSAYEDRISAGCRTDLFWRVVGVSTSLSGLVTINNYKLKCTRLSLSSYPTLSFPTIGFSDTSYGNSLAYFNGSSISIYDLNTKFGWIEDNLHGIKYYDEPITGDIGDTTVVSFIGSIDASSSTLNVMIPEVNGLGSLFEENQLITCEKSGVFVNDVNRIIGIGTTIVDLSAISPGIGITVVNTLDLETASIGIVSFPESDGSFINFTVLNDPQTITSINEYSLPFQSNPFSPQTIGIINSSNIGIGRKIYYDNSGNPSATQSWQPENQIIGIEDVPDVVEPSVGAGKIYYKDGFTQIPTSPEGAEIVVNILNGSIYQALPSCPTQETNLTNAIAIRDSKETELLSNSSDFNIMFECGSALRSERDLLNSQIWGLRQSIGGEIEEIDRYSSLESYLDTQTINNILQ